MARYLVIVESPAKVKTIKKFLGSNYVVTASNGHVRDLPKSQLGVDVEHDYEPKYITIRGKGEILANLRKEVKKADKVYLATDPDREGEAISWHLSQALKLENKKTYRISFNEITKNAVKASLKNAREIDMDLVDAQQARRVLDRIVGYRISPLLWAKVKRGLSAGRVQSVALRIIADREEEINAFIPEEYWTLDANLKVEGEKKILTAKFYGTEKKKMTIRSKEELEQIVQAGLYAPSGHNYQTWKFTVVTSKEEIQKLAEMIGKKLKREHYDMYQPQVLLIPSNKKDNPHAMEDNACALENIFLAAHSFGVGSVWINQLRDVCEEKEIREILRGWEIPDDHQVFGIAALGYAKAHPKQEVKKIGTVHYVE